MLAPSVGEQHKKPHDRPMCQGLARRTRPAGRGSEPFSSRFVEGRPIWCPSGALQVRGGNESIYAGSGLGSPASFTPFTPAGAGSEFKSAAMSSR